MSEVFPVTAPVSACSPRSRKFPSFSLFVFGLFRKAASFSDRPAEFSAEAIYDSTCAFCISVLGFCFGWCEEIDCDPSSTSFIILFLLCQEFVFFDTDLTNDFEYLCISICMYFSSVLRLRVCFRRGVCQRFFERLLRFRLDLYGLGLCAPHHYNDSVSGCFCFEP